MKHFTLFIHFACVHYIFTVKAFQCQIASFACMYINAAEGKLNLLYRSDWTVEETKSSLIVEDAQEYLASNETLELQVEGQDNPTWDCLSIQINFIYIAPKQLSQGALQSSGPEPIDIYRPPPLALGSHANSSPSWGGDDWPVNTCK